MLAASLVVAAVALAIVTIGVLRVGGDIFESLMMAAGDSADHARAMFDESVTVVFIVAAAVAAMVALLLAVVFTRRLARPIERLAVAAGQIAEGDLSVRVPEDGPAELRALAAAYNTMAERLAEQDAIRREFVINASPRAADPAHEPAGLSRGTQGRRPAARSRHVRLTPRGSRPAHAAGRVTGHPGRRRGRPPGARAGRAGGDRACVGRPRRTGARASLHRAGSHGRGLPRRGRPTGRAHASARQPPPERSALHARGRPGPGDRLAGSRGGDGPGLQLRAGHSARRPTPRVGALLPR